MALRDGRTGYSTDGARRRTRPSKGRRTAIVLCSACVVFGLMAAAFAVSGPSARQPGRAWINYSTVTLDNIGDVGEYSSLALDSQGHVYIAYYDSANGDLKLANNSGGTWSIGLVPSNGGVDVGQYCSLAIGPDDTRYISYYDVTNGNLRVYTNGSGGSDQNLDASSNVGQFTSITVNQVTKTVALSYYDLPNRNLKYAMNVTGNSTWTTGNVDTGGDVGMYSNTVSLYDNDSLSILYYDSSAGALKNAWIYATGPWNDVTIDDTGNVGQWPSQAVYGATWYGAYYDKTNGDLKFMEYTGAIGNTTVVDSVGDVGQYTAMAVNSTGHPFITYYDNSSKNLKLAWYDQIWHNVTLDSTGDVGQYSSIKFDSNDVLHISYYDATNTNLKYITVTKADLAALIPEFGTVVLPVVGIGALMVLVAARRRQD